MRFLDLAKRCRTCRSPWILTIVLCCISFALFQACSLYPGQNYPKILATKWDVRLANAHTERIRIPTLPIEDYPLLAKFKRLKDVDFYWEGANDAKLWELSKIGFTNLQQIGLLDCPLVTDKGIRAVADIPSIRGLALEGTSITDAALQSMATTMNLTGVNVSNCKGVTRAGIQTLAICPSLTEFGFSADDWTDTQVVELIDSFTNVTWCGIVDPKKKLNEHLLKAKGRARGITVVLRSAGALQEMWEFRSKHAMHR